MEDGDAVACASLDGQSITHEQRTLPTSHDNPNVNSRSPILTYLRPNTNLAPEDRRAVARAFPAIVKLVLNAACSQPHVHPRRGHLSPAKSYLRLSRRSLKTVGCVLRPAFRSSVYAVATAKVSLTRRSTRNDVLDNIYEEIHYVGVASCCDAFGLVLLKPSPPLPPGALAAHYLTS